ncbi:hypothetical protein L1887_03728 [Cichorium endivia]|nr:hypothetical protein L1887_03728 [Cichorium endivia]
MGSLIVRVTVVVGSILLKIICQGPFIIESWTCGVFGWFENYTCLLNEFCWVLAFMLCFTQFVTLYAQLYRMKIVAVGFYFLYFL